MTTRTEYQREHKPPWFKARFPAGPRYQHLFDLMREHRLHTVCEEARCPNIGECWNAGTATFMILGDTCTRACGFCAINSGRPDPIDPLEPYRLAQTVDLLGLDYAVITAVNRDDVPDGGASVFAACIRAIRHRRPQCDVEVLITDFDGNRDALAEVVAAEPAVLNYNTETVPRFYPRMRPKHRYEDTLDLLAHVKRLDPTMPTKTGLMVGVGETFEELERVFTDLRERDVDLLTVGQYLRPSAKHVPVARYWHPDEFEQLKEMALGLGFRHVESGPLVRSSYHAGDQARAAREALRRERGDDA